MTSNGSGPEASETKKSRWKWARWLAVVISVGGVIYLLAWYVPDVLVRHAASAVVPAWIGAVATVLGVGATAAVAIFAFWYARLTNQATIKAANENLKDQGKQLDKTLAAQREQLDETLAAQREQLKTTLAAQREQLDSTLTRMLNERFATAAGQLGGDKPAAVRLAGVYAMAGLADDWPENRQTCVDVLCAYLRLPYDPDPGDDATAAARAAYRANREVRHTVIRVITAHLKEDAAESWQRRQGLNFDFTGVVFDGGSFADARFSGGEVSFSGAEFADGTVSFDHARFTGGRVDFSGAEFSGGTVSFGGAKFSGGWVDFSRAQFTGGTVRFGGGRHFTPGAEFSGGPVSFGDAAIYTPGAEFSGEVSFSGARFADGKVDFGLAKFSGGEVDFRYAWFSDGKVDFGLAKFSGGEVDFRYAWFSGGWVDFNGAEFSRGPDRFDGPGSDAFSSGKVDFSRAKFSGGKVDFSRAKFSGGEVDFSRPGEWSAPPLFPRTGRPPQGVILPNIEGLAQPY